MLVGVTGAAMAWSTFMHAGATVSLGGRCHTEVFGMLLIDGHCQWSQRRRYDCRVNCVYVYLNICMVYVYVYIYKHNINYIFTQICTGLQDWPPCKYEGKQACLRDLERLDLFPPASKFCTEGATKLSAGSHVDVDLGFRVSVDVGLGFRVS